MSSKKKTVLFDGAMGTYLQSRDHIDLQSVEEANLLHPKDVEEAHRAYIDAGAEAILTNTYAANTDALRADFAHVREIIDAACSIAARAAAGTDTQIFASIGPIAGEGADVEYLQIIDAFMENGLCRFVFESFSDPNSFAELARYIKAKCPDGTVICEGTVAPDGFSRSGFAAQQFIDAAKGVPEIDAVGFNCTCGPGHLLQIFETLNTDGVTTVAMPNAGFPAMEHGRTVYPSDPEYFADRLAAIAASGVTYVGGCCGTTPEHIAQMARILEKGIRIHPSSSISVPRPPEEIPEIGKERSFLAVELDPPLESVGAQEFFANAEAIAAAGPDLLTIADCPVGRARGDSSVLASMLKSRYGIEVMPHLTCRDRNLNASKALLLGLHMADVRNVLLVTGDPIPAEERERIRSVFHFNSVNLASVVRALNESVFAQKPFRIMGALNVNAASFRAELRHAKKKVEAGMHALLTQPVMDERAAKNLQRAREELGVPILAGIMPIVSYRNACFINNEMGGIHVPDEVVEAHRDKTREQSTQLAVEFALRDAERIRGKTDGYYIVTMLRRADISKRIVEEIAGWKS